MLPLTRLASFPAVLSAILARVLDFLNAAFILFETGGVLTADGTEQTLHINNAPLGTHEPRTLLIDLDNMQQGDTIAVRVYYRIAAPGALQLEDYQTYTGADGGLANSIKLVTLVLNPNRFGVQITLEQTAGVNRTFRWEYFEEA